MLGTIFERFVEQSPVSVMVRGLMERVFAPSTMNELLEATAEVQYTRELLFSSVVELMSLAVCTIHPSVHAAYRAFIETNVCKLECGLCQTQRAGAWGEPSVGAADRASDGRNRQALGWTSSSLGCRISSQDLGWFVVSRN
jgi:hypothetical protein